MTDKHITLALDGTGGDNANAGAIASAVRFATVLNPDLNILVFGSQKLKEALSKEKMDHSRCQFVSAPESIPQDEDPRKVLEGYRNSAMRKAIEAVECGKADAAISSGGTGPLVALSRHILGVFKDMRPALCARIPGGKDKFSLMLDLGANAVCTAKDLHSFAVLGHLAYRTIYGEQSPRVSVLNVGSERNKGSLLVREARDLIEKDTTLNACGFVEGDRLFTSDADVIVTDGFTGNVALKAAEGVAKLFLKSSGLKGVFSKLARPDWLIPWQYNGSVLLGVQGLIIKSHGSAGSDAVGVALNEAYNYVRMNLINSIENELNI